MAFGVVHVRFKMKALPFDKLSQWWSLFGIVKRCGRKMSVRLCVANFEKLSIFCHLKILNAGSNAGYHKWLIGQLRWKFIEMKCNLFVYIERIELISIRNFFFIFIFFHFLLFYSLSVSSLLLVFGWKLIYNRLINCNKKKPMNFILYFVFDPERPNEMYCTKKKEEQTK